jgi:hypothetical protein
MQCNAQFTGSIIDIRLRKADQKDVSCLPTNLKICVTFLQTTKKVIVFERPSERGAEIFLKSAHPPLFKDSAPSRTALAC